MDLPSDGGLLTTFTAVAASFGCTGDADRPMSLPSNGDALMYSALPVKPSAMAASPFSAPPGGHFATEPSLDEFEAIAAKAFSQLPQKFRALCEDLVIRVEDFPTDEVIHRMKATSKFQILGLFRGVGLPFRFESAPMRMPNMIWLYRRPILAYWSRHQDTLEAIIAHVLVHEIGHHFGFSDDDMHGIEDRAD
jgi:predicted Zn-dependent protease with MMP-like domain